MNDDLQLIIKSIESIKMADLINTFKTTALGVAEFFTPILKVVQHLAPIQ